MELSGSWRALAADDQLRRDGIGLDVDDSMWPEVDVPECLSRHENDASQCSFPRAGHTYLDEPLAKAEKAAAPEAVRFVDLTRRLCPGDVCQVVEGDTVMYRDNHHLTTSYSKSLAEPLGDAVEAAIT